MNLDIADSLASFINDNSSRFQATVFDFSNKNRGWVIVAERLDNGSQRIYKEPIANAHEYLRRAQDGLLQIDSEYHKLLLKWQDSYQAVR